ncbi:hypothetical protein J6590_041471 [Homalodisca vitripennis]|nr:hypothetical protein J6590_041471 [Homalodisca vitripennis]
MELNPKECVVMHFSRSEVVFSYGYAINENKLKTVDESASPLHQSSGNKLGYLCMETPIHTVEELFDIQPLFLRWAYHDLNFLRGLVNGDRDCPDLLGAVTFTVPRGTRSKSVFSRRFQPTNYTQNHGISRLLRTGEAASSSVNFFGNSSFRTDAIGFLRDWK